MAELESTVISRSEARAAGLKRYFTGKPCKYGHVCYRQVSNGVCSKCFARITKNYVKRFPDVKRKLNFRYAKEHPRWIREARHRYYLKNKKKICDYAKRWAAAHPEKRLNSARECKRRNPHYRRNRKARKRGNGGRHTSREIREIILLQKEKCAYCRVSIGKKYHVDHIIPLIAGGRNDRANLQVLCVKCNLSKSKRDPVEYAQSLGMLL